MATVSFEESIVINDVKMAEMVIKDLEDDQSHGYVVEEDDNFVDNAIENPRPIAKHIGEIVEELVKK